MTEHEAGQLAGLIKLLANPTRLEILLQLSEGPMTTGELSRSSLAAGSESSADHHLRLLQLGGLVDGKTSMMAPNFLSEKGKRFVGVVLGLLGRAGSEGDEAPPPLDPPAEIPAGEAAGPGDAADGVGFHPAQ